MLNLWKEGGVNIATKKENKKKYCSCCSKEKPLSEFYMSKSPLHALDGKTPLCKDCVIKSSLNTETGEIDEIKFKNILRQIDKPFYKDNLQSAINQFKKENSYIKNEEVKYYGDAIIRLYMKNIASLRQVSNKSYDDSERDGFIQKHSTVIQKTENAEYKKALKKKKDEEIINVEDDNFEVTQDMIDMFGEGYTRLEYKKMLKKYNDMTKTYVIQTNLHKEALLTYVRFKVKEEMATSRGDVQEAQKWYQAAQDAAEKAKITPKQLTKEDLQGGITSFSEIFKAVEQAVDVIPILPQFKYRPNDALDFVIWCYINYARDLQGLPQCSYQDVYKFYDKKKQEYLDQYGDPYGIFTDDTTEKNRESIEKFITLPKDYEDGDS